MCVSSAVSHLGKLSDVVVKRGAHFFLVALRGAVNFLCLAIGFLVSRGGAAFFACRADCVCLKLVAAAGLGLFTSFGRLVYYFALSSFDVARRILVMREGFCFGQVAYSWQLINLFQGPGQILHPIQVAQIFAYELPSLEQLSESTKFTE